MSKTKPEENENHGVKDRNPILEYWPTEENRVLKIYRRFVNPVFFWTSFSGGSLLLVATIAGNWQPLIKFLEGIPPLGSIPSEILQVMIVLIMAAAVFSASNEVLKKRKKNQFWQRIIESEEFRRDTLAILAGWIRDAGGLAVGSAETVDSLVATRKVFGVIGWSHYFNVLNSLSSHFSKSAVGLFFYPFTWDNCEDAVKSYPGLHIGDGPLPEAVIIDVEYLDTVEKFFKSAPGVRRGIHNFKLGDPVKILSTAAEELLKNVPEKLKQPLVKEGGWVGLPLRYDFNAVAWNAHDTQFRADDFRSLASFYGTHGDSSACSVYSVLKKDKCVVAPDSYLVVMGLLALCVMGEATPSPFELTQQEFTQLLGILKEFRETLHPTLGLVSDIDKMGELIAEKNSKVHVGFGLGSWLLTSSRTGKIVWRRPSEGCLVWVETLVVRHDEGDMTYRDGRRVKFLEDIVGHLIPDDTIDDWQDRAVGYRENLIARPPSRSVFAEVLKGESMQLRYRPHSESINGFWSIDSEDDILADQKTFVRKLPPEDGSGDFVSRSEWLTFWNDFGRTFRTC